MERYLAPDVWAPLALPQSQVLGWNCSLAIWPPNSPPNLQTVAG